MVVTVPPENTILIKRMASNQPLTYNRRRAKRLAAAAVGGLPEKRPHAGNNVSHAHNTTKRLFKPNLQKTRVLVDGKMVSVRLDTRTIRNMTKLQKVRGERPKRKAGAKPVAQRTPARRASKKTTSK